MQKTAIKAFVYSFSVSLLAITVANRVFCYEPKIKDEPLKISEKNIVLFLKNDGAAKFPVKKIALNTLPEIEKQVYDTPQSEPEVILANSFDSIDFPLEIVEENSPPKEETNIALADVLYSPDKPLEPQNIDAVPIYLPEHDAKEPVNKEINADIIYAPKGKKQNIVKDDTPDEDQAIELARADKNSIIPLQKEKNILEGKEIAIGNPNDLNHIAMDNTNIPIQSMEKQLEKKLPEGQDERKDWSAMRENPWIVAKSNGGKNQLAKKDFADKSSDEISDLLNTKTDRQEIKVASETVKNLIIPIPEEILKDENLTPQLAYPSTSDDAKKEKIIDAKLKQEDEKNISDKELLSPIDEEIVLDAPTKAEEQVIASPIKQPIQEDVVEEKEDDNAKAGGIINALSSIFAKTAEDINDAKERAIAKAKVKRSLKKHLAKTRPVSIMPTEIRLSFQPNRAEISGQTLRWVQAFASKAAETPDMSLEIRIDGTSSMELQQKRLNLLHNILTNKGVEYSKINTVFTSREPNSFILRTVRHKRTGGTTEEANNSGTTNYIQW